MSNATRYETSNEGWPETMPPITREEAERAALRLARHFKFSFRRVRRCWIAAKPPYHRLNRGWRRLVHDLSHTRFEQLYPRKRAHDPLHARYEAEMVSYVLASGWLDGTLRPKPKAKPAPKDADAVKLTRTIAAIKRWRTKERRAKTALAKLEKRRKYYEKKATAAPTP